MILGTKILFSVLGGATTVVTGGLVLNKWGYFSKEKANEGVGISSGTPNEVNPADDKSEPPKQHESPSQPQPTMQGNDGSGSQDDPQQSQ